jgi:hypothetical protein
MYSILYVFGCPIELWILPSVNLQWLCVHVFNDPERLRIVIFGQSSVGVWLKYHTGCYILKSNETYYLNCTNNYAMITNLNKWQYYTKVGNKTWWDRHPKTLWRLMFLLHTENIIENIKVYLSQMLTLKKKSKHVIQ